MKKSIELIMRQVMNSFIAVQDYIHELHNTLVHEWTSASRRIKNIFYFLCYSLLFAVIFYFAFAAFRLTNTGFVWNIDGYRIELPARQFLRQYFLDGIQSFFATGSVNFPQFDFTLGMGMDPMSFLSTWYYEPINFLALLFPEDKMELFYTLLIVVHFYLVGAAFFIYSRYMGNSYFYTLLGAITYTFCGFALEIGIKHPCFLTPMIYLPILLVGIEKLLRRGEIFLLSFMVFLSLLTSYYYFYVNTILVLMYAAIQFVNRYCINRVALPKDVIKSFFYIVFKGLVSFLLGIGMAAITFFPSAFFFFNSNRTTANIFTDSLFSYGLSWLPNLFLTFVTNLETGYWVRLGFATIAFFALIIMFLRKGRWQLKAGTVLLIAFLCIPLAGFIFSGFSMVQNRWSYAFALLIAYIVTIAGPQLLQLTRAQKFILALSAAFFVVCTFLLHRGNIISMLSATMLIVTILSLLCVQRTSWFIQRVVMVALLATSVVLNATVLYKPEFQNFVQSFEPNGKATFVYATSPDTVMQYVDDDSFYRTEIGPVDFFNLNAPTINGYNTTAIYHNTQDKYYMQFMQEMENADLWSAVAATGWNNRAALLALGGVKYYVGVGERVVPPYGFKRMEYSLSPKTEGYKIFANETPLPIGYTYKSYITRNQYEQLNSIEKQEVILESVLLEDMPSGGYEQGVISPTAIRVEPTVQNTRGITYKDNKIEVAYPGATMELRFAGQIDCETYLRIDNFQIKEQAVSKWDRFGRYMMAVDVFSHNAHTHLEVLSEHFAYSHGMNSYVANLGYQTDRSRICTVVFASPGTYAWDDIAIYCQPMDSYDVAISELLEEPMENITVNDDYLTGTVKLSEDKILCLSIPYSPGWSATVDGQSIPVMRANTMYMAIPLTSGTHQIELFYQTPGLRLGKLISMISWTIMAGLFLRVHWKKIIKRRA